MARGVPLSLRLQYARPGEVMTSEGELLLTEDDMRRHLSELESPYAVAASYCSACHVEAYARLAAERYAALVGTDPDIARIALETTRNSRARRAA